MSSTAPKLTEEIVVRSVLIPLGDRHLLLPNSLVAEVFGYVTPDPIPGTPDWLLGSVGWRGVALPLISFESLIGGEVVPPGIKGRVIVLYGLGEQVAKVPYIGVLATDVPRLLRASADTLNPVSGQPAIPGIAAMAQVDDKIVSIPDIDYLVQRMAESL